MDTELQRFKNVVKNSVMAARINPAPPRFRKEYGMYVIELMSPEGDAVTDEFNFKLEDDANAAEQHAKALRGEAC